MSQTELGQSAQQEAFTAFLQRGGRSPSAIKRCLLMVETYRQFLAEECPGKRPGEASLDELEAFVDWLEEEREGSAKTHLWALRYYYQFVEDEEMAKQAGILREQRIKRAPFALAKFRGVNPEHAEALASAGVRDVKQMLKAGATLAGREALARRTGVPYSAILEMVKLSDLARISGIKAIRARLYVDAGVDSIEKLATWKPEELRAMLLRFVEETGFDGIAPLPKEAASAVAKAKRMRKVVTYDEGDA
jgi:predicted flap endonuclease-1-like 5' DNA nuclease